MTLKESTCDHVLRSSRPRRRFPMFLSPAPPTRPGGSGQKKSQGRVDVFLLRTGVKSTLLCLAQHARTEKASMCVRIGLSKSHAPEKELFTSTWSRLPFISAGYVFGLCCTSAALTLVLDLNLAFTFTCPRSSGSTHAQLARHGKDAQVGQSNNQRLTILQLTATIP